MAAATVLLSALLCTPAQAQPDASLSVSSFPANRHAKIDLEVRSFGRYAIFVQSKTGVQLQLVDKVIGPRERSGAAGDHDGRIDVFLDRGTYRILAHGASKAQDTAQIRVRRFDEVAETQAQLVEFKPIDVPLADFQSRSYWIDITSRRRVTLEAAGRNLEDLRLFKEGTWLVDATARRAESTPAVGQPLTVLRLSPMLEPGLYLVSAFGGLGQKWANDDGRHPFHLRYGIPKLPNTLRRRYVMGPLGFQRFIVPRADLYRLELPEARPAKFEVGLYSADRPFDPSGIARGEITKKSVPPVATAHKGVGSGSALVTITAPKGQPYVLQHLTQIQSFTKARRWLSTSHTGDPRDSLDATGILVQRIPRSSRAAAYKVIDDDAISLSSSKAWQRRFNLLSEATIFFQIEEAGEYVVEGGGNARAVFRVEPFFVNRPQDYRSPEFESSGHDWDLEKGFYVLTIKPKKAGIITVTAKKSRGFLGKIFGSDPKVNPPQPSVRFERAPENSIAYFGRQPGVQLGVVASDGPFDITSPVALSLGPKERVLLPIRVTDAIRVNAVAEDGSRAKLRIGTGGLQTLLRPPPGKHRLTVVNPSNEIMVLSVAGTPLRFDPDVPLPPLPDGRLAGLPILPEIKAKEPQFFDLKRKQEKTFLITADETQLYRVESSGLLATRASLRTRMRPSFASESQNGVGRNFLLQQFLGAGLYQVTVKTEGRTRGHLGLHLNTTPTRRAGRIRSGEPARAKLRKGEMLSFSFNIKESGRYRISAKALGKVLKCRLEDAEGWPIVPPNVPASFDRNFDPGVYRLVVLPEVVDRRVVTTFSRVNEPVETKGPGPHLIPFDRTVGHRYRRKVGAKPTPDRWHFDLDADATVALRMTGRMKGRMWPKGSPKLVKTFSEAVPFKGALAKGRYLVRVSSAYQDNDVHYALNLTAEQLTSGRSRSIRMPATIPIAVGSAGLVDLASVGDADVRAQLHDARGRLIAQSDDRKNDWNFHIVRRLEPGKYELTVSSVTGRARNTRIEMLQRRTIAEKPVKLPHSERRALTKNEHSIPFQLAKGTRLLTVGTQSISTLGLIVECETNGAWRIVGQGQGTRALVALPYDTPVARSCRARVWADDARPTSARIDLRASDPPRKSVASLRKGTSVRPLRGSNPPVVAFAVDAAEPSTIRLRDPAKQLKFSSRLGRAAEAHFQGLVRAEGARFWIVEPVTRRRAKRYRGSVVRLRRMKPALVMLRPGQHNRVAVRSEGKVPHLVRATAAMGQPAVRFTGASLKASGAAFGLGAGESVGVVLDPSRVKSLAAEVWDAGDSKNAYEVKLETLSFIPDRATDLTTTGVARVLEGGHAAVLRSPQQLEEIRVSGEPGIVVAVSSSDLGLESVFILRDKPIRFEAESKTITLINPATLRSPFVVDVLPKRAAPFQISSRAAEVFVTPLPAAGEPRTLQWFGAHEIAVLGNDGSVSRGTSVVIPAAGGLALVDHQGGHSRGAMRKDSTAPLQLFRAAPALSLKAGMSIDASAAVLKAPGVEPARLLVLRAERAIISEWRTAEGTKPAALFAAGSEIAQLHTGPGEWGIAALDGRPLGDALTIREIAVPRLKEGVAEPIMLAPGDRRVYTFSIDRKRKIGIGVRTRSSDLQVELTTADGRLLGRGVAQMPELEPGTYLLHLIAPVDSKSIKARPAVVGIDAPSTSAPEEVVAKYLRGERE